MPPSSAYLLVSHGSRDPRPQLAMAQLRELVQQRISSLIPSERVQTVQHSTITPYLGIDRGSRPRVLFQSSVQNPVVPLVSTAVLELHPDPLHVQLQTAAESAIRAGYTHLNVVPLFLLPGVHVMEDIPNEVAIAQAALGQQIAIHVSPHLGRHPQLTTLLTLPHDSPAHAARVLIAHGSRRSGSDAAVEAIAAAMAARPAYWSKPPSLETQILQLVKTGCCDIVILPYFLFPGGIVDAIAQQLEQLSPQFPYTKFYLAAPIGVSETLADLVIELTVLS